MTVDSFIYELGKFKSNKDYELIFVGDETVPEREVRFIISDKEEFVIVRYPRIEIKK